MKKVAVLEDDENLIELYQTILDEEGYKMHVVALSTKVSTTLESIRSIQPAMLILDLHLPGISSLEIMQALLDDEQFKSLPILVCSASRPSLSHIREQVSQIGYEMPRVLEKPFDLYELLDHIRDIIGEPN